MKTNTIENGNYTTITIEGFESFSHCDVETGIPNDYYSNALVNGAKMLKNKDALTKEDLAKILPYVNTVSFTVNVKKINELLKIAYHAIMTSGLVNSLDKINAERVKANNYSAEYLHSVMNFLEAELAEIIDIYLMERHLQSETLQTLIN